MKDPLKVYALLRSNLIAEKSEVEARIRDINNAIGGVTTPSNTETTSTKRRGRPANTDKAKSVTSSGPTPRRGRSTSGASLKVAAIAALKGGKTLSRQDLLIAVVDGGYKFAAKNPLNSVSTLVYSNKKIFKVKSGKVSLA